MESKLVEVAKEAVLAGSKQVMRFWGKSLEEIGLEYKPQDGDTPRTIIDRKSSGNILGVIKKHYPHHAVYGEETGLHSGSGNYTWVIDPFDGTSNAPRKLPYSVVGLAIMKGKELIISAVCNPFEKKLYFSEKGSGAYVAGISDEFETVVGEPKKLRVSKTSDPKARFIHIDTLFNDKNRKRKTAFIADVTEYANNVRMTGSNIHYGALLAEGRTDIWFIDSVGGWWDIAPGSLLIQESGGKMTHKTQVAIASNNIGDHAELTKIVQKHYAGYQGFR